MNDTVRARRLFRGSHARQLVDAAAGLTAGASLVDLQANEVIGPAFPNDLPTGGSVAPGATHVVTGVGDTVLAWNLDVGSWPEIACRAAGRNMTLQEWEQFGPVGEPYNATCPQWPDPSA